MRDFRHPLSRSLSRHDVTMAKDDGRTRRTRELRALAARPDPDAAGRLPDDQCTGEHAPPLRAANDA